MAPRPSWTITARPTDDGEMGDTDVVLRFDNGDPEWGPVTLHLTREEAASVVTHLMDTMEEMTKVRPQYVNDALAVAIATPLDPDGIIAGTSPDDAPTWESFPGTILQAPPEDPRVALLEDLVGAHAHTIAILERNLEELRWPKDAAARAAYGLDRNPADTVAVHRAATEAALRRDMGTMGYRDPDGRP